MARTCSEVLLEWLVEQHPGCLAGPWSPSAYAAPARKGDRGTLEALRRLGVPWGAENVVARAVERCPVPALRWLVGQGAPVGSRQGMERAVGRGGAGPQRGGGGVAAGPGACLLCFWIGNHRRL